MHIAVFIENGEGEVIKVIETDVASDDELTSLETVAEIAFELEKVLKKFVESKAKSEGEK